MVGALIRAAWGVELRRLSARLHLLGLIAAAVVPVWLFAAYLLAQYAFQERSRFERVAVQVARQTSLVVEGELANLLTVIEGLSKSSAIAAGDFKALQDEASHLVAGSDRIILLRERSGRELLDTRRPYGSDLPPGIPLNAADLSRLKEGGPLVSGVHAGPIPGEYRIAIALAVRGPAGADWILAITVPTARIRDALMIAAPPAWTVAVGDRDGAYVARSQLHEETTGRPGLPEYLEKVVGHSGTFTAPNFQGQTLLAGYYRSAFSDWFYTANIPLSTVQAPLWRSLQAIGAIGLLAMLISLALAYVVGKSFSRAAADLASRAAALGHGQPVLPISTTITEFGVIADALVTAQRNLTVRASELETVMETVPAAVWFTYDPHAREVIRNRFAAELMGLPTDLRKAFGAPDQVIETIAMKDGKPVSRDDRPLSRAMRGEQTNNEEFAYTLPSGVERTLLTSARPILDAGGKIVGAVQISLDISERKRGEEQRKLLVSELNHRVKNTLAVVQSIASQTLRSATSLTEAGKSLSSRLVSLAKAHDILTHENWSGADLRELLVTALAPHAGLDRFEFTGASVWLPPPLALSLALAIHELATNAIKYGALSTANGTVSLSWTLDGEADEHLRIEWREQGGPRVAPAERKGFGTRLLEKILVSESGGSVRIDYEPAGVVCVLKANVLMPLRTVGSSSEMLRPGSLNP